MWAGDRTGLQLPSSRRRANTGSSPRSIRSSTSPGSAASTSTASTRRKLDMRRKQLSGIHPAALLRRARAGLESGDCPQIVAAACVWFLAVSQRALELTDQQSVLRDGPWPTPHDPRELASRAQHQPALEHMQCRAIADHALVELLPPLEVLVSAGLVGRRVQPARPSLEGEHRVKRRSRRCAGLRPAEALGHYARELPNAVAQRIEVVDRVLPQGDGSEGHTFRLDFGNAVRLADHHPDAAERALPQKPPHRSLGARVAVVLADQQRHTALPGELDERTRVGKAWRERLLHEGADSARKRVLARPDMGVGRRRHHDHVATARVERFREAPEAALVRNPELGGGSLQRPVVDVGAGDELPLGRANDLPGPLAPALAHSGDRYPKRHSTSRSGSRLPATRSRGSGIADAPQDLVQVGGVQLIAGEADAACHAEALGPVLSGPSRDARPGLDRGVSHANRPFEGRVVPVDDQVGESPARCAHPDYVAQEGAPIGASEPPECGFDLLAGSLVVLRSDRTRGLPPLQVHPDPAVLIARQCEGPGPAPVEGRHHGWRCEPVTSRLWDSLVVPALERGWRAALDLRQRAPAASTGRLGEAELLKRGLEQAPDNSASWAHSVQREDEHRGVLADRLDQPADLAIDLSIDVDQAGFPIRPISG